MAHIPKNLARIEPAEYYIKDEELINKEYGYFSDERPIDLHISHGVINLDKPLGPTSHEVSAWVRKILGLNKAGHAGTLDPHVSGILPVGLEKATRVINSVHTAAKEYVCLMRLHQLVPKRKIERLFRQWATKLYQRPPLRSNVKRRLRVREIHYLDLIEMKKEYVLFRVGCESGTYIRKLCFDFGEVLFCGAQMEELRRTQTGFFIEDSTLVTLHDVKDAWTIYQEEGDERYIRAAIMPMEKAVIHWKKIYIRDSAVDAIAHGAKLSVVGVLRADKRIEKGDDVAIMSNKGELVALAQATMTGYKMCQINSSWCALSTSVLMDRGVYPKWNS